MRKAGHAPLLIVIAGPNGSGKTTITSEVLASEWLEDAVYINPDIGLRRSSATGTLPKPCARLRFSASNGVMGKQYVDTVPEWAQNILPKQ